MNLSSWGALLLVLGGCAVKAKPHMAGPAAPLAGVVKVDPPPAPAWRKDLSPSRWPVRATAWEELPLEDPARLVRDLADAKACVAIRSELARFVVSRLERTPPLLAPRSLAAVRSGLERSSGPGCSIARRDCGNDGKSRRWCWSEGALDSSMVLVLARRELARVDSLGAERLVVEIFRDQP